MTPRGIFELKYFLHPAFLPTKAVPVLRPQLRVDPANRTGRGQQETTVGPSHRRHAFAEQGIVVARRTVAKYRESMEIQPANLRKALAAQK